MANFIKIFDTVDFVPLSQEKKDNYFAGAQSGRPLIVKIAATHSGLITRNNGFYMPDRMRKGSASFTSQYNKPIQVHHNDDKDPVGRVIKAEYVDSSGSLSQRIMNKVKDSISGNLFTDFISGKLPFIQSVNFICDQLNKKDSVLDDPDYQGLGFIKLTAQISDPDAAQKILDGRYLTGSVGLTTDAAVCSVCKQDWTGEDGRCDHKPGQVYDGAKAFIITGNLNYDEYSFVNVPADRHSRVMEVNVNGIVDSVRMENSVGRAIAVNIITDSITQEDNMKAVATKIISDARFAILGKEYLDKLLASLEDEKAFDKWAHTDEIDFAITFEQDLDKEAIVKVFALGDEAKLDALRVIRPFAEETSLTKIIQDKLSDAEAFFTAINEAEWADYSELEDEALVQWKIEHTEDAKLSGAQRKRLPGSSFCGPNKSFPVPDCAHVTAARRLIGRASVSSAGKAKILACVSRKSSAMGCDTKNKDKVEPIIPENKDKKETVCNCANKYADEHKLAIDKLTAELAKLTADHVAVLTEINTSNKKNDSIQKDLDATRAELKVTQEDLTQMADQLFVVKSESTTYLVDKLITYRVLSGEVIEDQVKVKDELNILPEDSLKEKLTEIIAKVDMKKITDSINSGLARSPTGTITDPTLNNQKKVYDKKVVEQIEQEYLRIKFGGSSNYGKGPDAAQRFKQDMQHKGFLPIG